MPLSLSAAACAVRVVPASDKCGQLASHNALAASIPSINSGDAGANGVSSSLALSMANKKAFLLVLVALALVLGTSASGFEIIEAAISDVQLAFREGSLTSVQLVNLYLQRVVQYNSQLNAIIEINPDVLYLAKKADQERVAAGGHVGGLHGVPVLLKDNIGTTDKLDTTAGSFALLGSKVTTEAFIVKLLRRAGAIIFGKANLSEFLHVRSLQQPQGFSPRGGQTNDAYNVTLNPGGSSSGPAVAVAANLVLLSIGTETQGSITEPASRNAVASIKPTPGLTSRTGIVPISFSVDSPGPIGKYVEDVVALLDVIAVPDPADPGSAFSCQPPSGGYQAHKLLDGLVGKRIGIARDFFQGLPDFQISALEIVISVLIKHGAIVIDNTILNPAVFTQIFNGVAPFTAPLTADKFLLLSDFKVNINKYLATLKKSPVATLEDIIAFDQADPREQFSKFPDDLFIAAQNLTSGQSSQAYLLAQQIVARQNQQGLVQVFSDNQLDALLAPADSSIDVPASFGGFPTFTIPAGYDPSSGLPFGVSFLGKPCNEATLIEVVFPLEGILGIRDPPPAFP